MKEWKKQEHQRKTSVIKLKKMTNSKAENFKPQTSLKFRQASCWESRLANPCITCYLYVYVYVHVCLCAGNGEPTEGEHGRPQAV